MTGRARVVIFAIFILTLNTRAYAQGVSQVERSQEIIEKDRILKKRIETEMFFIKDIILEGEDLVPQDKIEEITSGFKNRALSLSDISLIIDLLRQLYAQEGFDVDISYNIEGEILRLKVAKRP